MYLRVARRFATAIIQMLVASFVIFALLSRAPGGPLDRITGGAQRMSKASRERLISEYHLDQPFIRQYAHWLIDAVRGDFGISISTRDSVASVVAPKIGPTVELALYAFALTLVLGVSIGTLAAIRRGTTVDTVTSAIVVAGSAASPYLTGILLIAGLGVAWPLFPIFGAGTGVAGRLYHLTLPAIALSVTLVALIARTTRTGLAEVLATEFISVARSRGLPETVVVVRHGLRNALIPILTASGLTFGFLISGTVFVENVFGLGGLGSLMVDSVQSQDYAVAEAVALMFIATFIMLNLLVDLLYVVVDPRTRHPGAPT